MKRILFLCILVSFYFQASMAEKSSQIATVQEKPVYRIHLSKTKVYETLEGLTQDSQTVVRGRIVRKLESRELIPRFHGIDPSQQEEYYKKWLQFFKPRIVTDAELVITDVLKGDLKRGKKIMIMQQGGETIDAIYESPETPNFESGEEVVVFLRKYTNGFGETTENYVVVGSDDGVYDVNNDFVTKRETRIDFSRMSRTGSEFTAFAERVRRVRTDR